MFKFFDDVRREVDDAVKPKAKRRLSNGTTRGNNNNNNNNNGDNNNNKSNINNNTPEHANNIPKEELMHLSMKLSKRLKAVQQVNAKLVATDKKSSIRINNLENFISEIILSPSISHLSIEDIRKKFDENHKQKIKVDDKQNDDEYNNVVDNNNSSENTTNNNNDDGNNNNNNNNNNSKIIKKLNEQLEKFKNDNMKHVEVSRSLRDELSNLRTSMKEDGNDTTVNSNANDSMKKAEEKIVLLQLRLDKLRNKDEEDTQIHSKLLSDHSSLRHNFDGISSKLKETSKILEDTLNANSLLENKIESLNSQLHDSQLLSAEKNSLIAEMREKMSQRNVKAREEKLDQAHKDLHLLKQNVLEKDNETSSLSTRLQNCQSAMKDMSREIDNLKSDMLKAKTKDIQNQGQIQRLTNSLEIAAASRRDLDENAHNARLEHNEILSKNKILLDREKDFENRLSTMQTTIQSNENQLKEIMEKYENAVKRRKETMEKHEKQINEMVEHHKTEKEKELKARQEEFELEIERVKATTSRKSSHAIRLVQQKDAELVQLRKRNEQLEEEVSSGRPEERKILEYAQDQAKRESYTRAIQEECETLKTNLKDKTEEVGRLELKLQKLTRLLNGMGQNVKSNRNNEGNTNGLTDIERGFGINLMYLKNVVLQYMSFEEGSSERLRLIPVISTILKDIEEGKVEGGGDNSII